MEEKSVTRSLRRCAVMLLVLGTGTLFLSLPRAMGSDGSAQPKVLVILVSPLVLRSPPSYIVKRRRTCVTVARAKRGSHRHTGCRDRTGPMTMLQPNRSR